MSSWRRRWRKLVRGFRGIAQATCQVTPCGYARDHEPPDARVAGGCGQPGRRKPPDQANVHFLADERKGFPWRSDGTLLDPTELHAAPGCTHAVTAPAAGLAFLSGQVALDADFAIVGGDDLGEQTKAAMRNIQDGPRRHRGFVGGRLPADHLRPSAHAVRDDHRCHRGSPGLLGPSPPRRIPGVTRPRDGRAAHRNRDDGTPAPMGEPVLVAAQQGHHDRMNAETPKAAELNLPQAFLLLATNDIDRQT